MNLDDIIWTNKIIASTINFSFLSSKTIQISMQNNVYKVNKNLRKYNWQNYIFCLLT